MYFVFIFIRSEPQNPLHTQTLKIYIDELSKNTGLNKELNEEIIKRLLNVGLPQESSILRALKRWSFPLKNYSMNRVEGSIPIFIDIFTELIIKLESGEYEKAITMASSVHNLPGFVSKEYRMDSQDFWNDHIRFYSKRHNENFLLKHEKTILELRDFESGSRRGSIR